jgi:cytochrome c oxidase cbb3-type subunit 2
MAGSIYKKPVVLAVMATFTVLIGSVVTMAYPMLRADMHPKLDNLRTYSPLELAGRDIYQREGCMNCHTQVVRPLKSEVLRYGEYSKAGESAYEHPFLWGSKRTGPDLAREGGHRPDGWHVKHFDNPQAFEPLSNMPSYAFLAKEKLDPAEAKAHFAAMATMHPEMKATDADFADLGQKTETDALVAYMQYLGHAVRKPSDTGGFDLAAVNPVAGKADAIAKGKKVFADNCSPCHGDDGKGVEGLAPSVIDGVVLGEPTDMPDGAYFALITAGSDAKKVIGRKGLPDGGMTAFGGQLTKDDIWAVIAFLRSMQTPAVAPAPAGEKK